MNNPVLSCCNLSKIYVEGIIKVEVLNQINLAVDKAELVAIVGNSGSGKSTLLHLLGGLDNPTQGEVYLNGENIYNVTESEKCKLRNQYLGFVYQFHHLLPEFSALENVAMPLLIQNKLPLSQIRDQSSALLEQVGLAKRIHHRPAQLSGGERQRVAIARALIANPLCVLADEPTGNLDPHNADKILQLFFDLQRSNETSVVIVTHDFNIAKSADRTLKIIEGKLVPV